MKSTYVKWAAVLFVGLLVGFLMVWFQPWRIFTQNEVTEALPSPISSSQPTHSESGATPTPSNEVTAPKLLLEGVFISHEHETSGAVKVFQLEDGSRILRLEGLGTSDGPDLEVWLSDAPVIEGQDGWFVFDDGQYTSVGKLKGTQGDQNYEIPADVDLAQFSSVSIWCVRFNVSFGAATLVAP